MDASIQEFVVRERQSRKIQGGDPVWMQDTTVRNHGDDLDGSLVTELLRERRLFRDDVLSFRRHPDSVPEHVPVEIPVFRLHCPKHPGCSVTEVHSSAARATFGISLTFAGIGNRSEMELGVAADHQWATSDGKCLELVLAAEVAISFGTYCFNEEAIASGFNLEFVAPQSDILIQRQIPPEQDLCGRSPSHSDEVRLTPASPEMAISEGTAALTLSVSRSITATHQVGIQALGSTVSVGVNCRRTAKWESKRTTHLSSGAKYQAFAVGEFRSIEDAAEIVWAASRWSS